MGADAAGDNRRPPVELKYYLDLVNESSRRVRWVIFVLITAGVITFSCAWNTARDSWLVRRLAVASDVLMSKYPAPAARAPDLDAQRTSAVEHYVKLHPRAADPQRLRTYRDMLEDVYVHDTLFVTLPVFGIKFDINDIGLLAGFTFSVVLAMLRFSLERDYINLKLAFAAGNDRGCLPEWYKLLAMSQVLSQPPIPEVRESLFWRWLPRLLFALPLLVYGYVVIRDFASADVGLMVSNRRTLIVLGSEIVFSAFILFLTLACLQLTRVRERLWTEHAQAAFCSSTPDPVAAAAQ